MKTSDRERFKSSLFKSQRDDNYNSGRNFRKIRAKKVFSQIPQKFLMLLYRENIEVFENNDENKIPTFLNPIEPITSEIRPGWTSPNEDLSLTELKVSESPISLL